MKYFEAKEYVIEYKIETKSKDIVLTSDTFVAPKARAVIEYYNKWRESLVGHYIFDIHLIENGKDITKKINKFLELEAR